jgi:hypothetical protein
MKAMVTQQMAATSDAGFAAIIILTIVLVIGLERIRRR